MPLLYRLNSSLLFYSIMDSTCSARTFTDGSGHATIQSGGIYIIRLLFCNCSSLLAACGGSLLFVRGSELVARSHQFTATYKIPCEAPQALRSQEEKKSQVNFKWRMECPF